MTENKKPDWIAKLEEGDKKGTTPQSSVNQSGALSGNVGSSNSPLISSSSDRDNLVNQYVNAQKKQQLANLQNVYNKNISAIADQERATNEAAKVASNNASVQNQLANKNVSNYLANNGLLNSGTNAQLQMNSAGALQNNLGQIESDKQNQLYNLAQQRLLAQQNLNNDIANVNNGLDSQALQMQLNYLDNMQKLQAQQDFQREQALLNRQWQLEDNANNSVAWTDPYSGMTYQISPNTAAQLGYNIYNQQVKASSSGNKGGSPSSASDNSGLNWNDLSTAQKLSKQKEYNEAYSKGETNQSLDEWLYNKYGIGKQVVNIGNTTNRLSGNDTPTIDDVIAMVNDRIRTNEWGINDLEKNKDTLIDTIGFDNYQELYYYAQMKNKTTK